MLSTLSFTQNLQARTLTVEDQGYVILSSTRDITVEADGKKTEKYAMTFKVLSQNGIDAFGVYRMAYNSNTQTITVENIAVKNPEGVTTIDPKNIEEKSLFGGHSGFDETKTKIIPLPGIKIGSEIQVAYTIKTFHPPFPGVMGGRYYITFGTPVSDTNFKLTLPQNALFDIHDPAALVSSQIKKTNTADKTVLTLLFKNLPGIGTTQENNNLPTNTDVWIDISNVKTFNEASAIAAKGFDAVLAKPLPEKLAGLFGEKPRTPLSKEDAQKRLSHVLQTLSKNFRYFGDWRSVDGGYVPRELEEISKTGYGDCKDFSVLVVAAARHLGLSADAAITYRGDDPYRVPNFPNMFLYNHAVARVQIPGETSSENVWWIDATNPVPQLGINPFDIADRHALLLNAKLGSTTVTRDAPSKSTETVFITLDPSASPDTTYTADINLTGHEAWGVQMDLLGRSQKQIEEYLTDFIGVGISDAKNFQLTKNESSANAENKIHFIFSVAEKNGIARSGNLKILPIFVFGGYQSLVDVALESRKSDLNLANLRHIHTTQTIKPGSYTEVVGSPSECHIESPWITYDRRVTKTPEFKIEDDYTIKTYRVTLKEMQSPEFSKTQKELRDCLRGISVVVK